MNINNNIGDYAGIDLKNRKLLDLLNRKFKAPFTSAEAARALSLTDKRIRRLLPYFSSRGWLSRVRRGLYITVPLGATNPSEWTEDSWIIASSVFSPCYIGGWSACEHWGFTEQLFNTVLIVTTKKQRRQNTKIQNINFRLRWIPDYQFFGTQIVWRAQTRVQVSDPSKTIVDIISDPLLGGGIRHIFDILKEYFNSEYRDDNKLLSYLEKQKNGAAYKRIGYLIESAGISAPHILKPCREKMSKGYSFLEPANKNKGKYIRRWNLNINSNIE